MPECAGRRGALSGLEPHILIKLPVPSGTQPEKHENKQRDNDNRRGVINSLHTRMTGNGYKYSLALQYGPWHLSSRVPCE